MISFKFLNKNLRILRIKKKLKMLPSKDLAQFISYVICIIYFLFNFIYQLNDNWTNVIYSLKEIETNISKMVICFEIEDFIGFNCDKIEDKNYEKCKELVNFSKYVSNDQIVKSPNTIIQKANDLKIGELFILEPEYDYLEIYLESKMICNKYTLSEDNSVLFNIYNRYSIPIYVYLDEIDLSIDKYLFKYECDIFISCTG